MTRWDSITHWRAKGLWTGALLAIVKGVPLELRLDHGRTSKAGETLLSEGHAVEILHQSRS